MLNDSDSLKYKSSQAEKNVSTLGNKPDCTAVARSTEIVHDIPTSSDAQQCDSSPPVAPEKAYSPNCKMNKIDIQKVGNKSECLFPATPDTSIVMAEALIFGEPAVSTCVNILVPSSDKSCVTSDAEMSASACASLAEREAENGKTLSASINADSKTCDPDVAECIVEGDNEEATVCLEEIIEEEERLFDEARAVIGNAEADRCSYEKGYIKRQPLFACMTCCTDPASPAGLCFACSLTCHQGHDLVELYTKRLFRCDCGNAKFPELKCKLLEAKTAKNDLNIYDQTFTGLFCTCSRPYPDPENEDESDMLQCVVCEDWFHAEHLDLEESLSLNSLEFEEMICATCIAKHPFLAHYALRPDPVDHGDKSCPTETSDSGGNSQQENEEPNVTTACPINSSQVAASLKNKTACFTDGWRSKMCCCEDCKALLSSHKLAFLLDPEDTVASYEAVLKTSPDSGPAAGGSSMVQQAMDAFQTTYNPQQQVGMLHEYNYLRDELKDYLKDFAQKRKVVTADDVKTFFDGLKNAKRIRVDIPEFCR